MNKPIVVLEKERDFTDVINVTFAFITQEFKLMFKVILLYAGLPIIMASVAAAVYSQDTFTNLFSALKGNITTQPPNFTMMALMYLLMMVAMFLMSGLVAAYLNEYKLKGHGGFTASDVWRGFIDRFGNFFLVSVVSMLMVSVGLALCLVPGIYLAIPLSLATTIVYLERTNLSDTLDRCFKLIKESWWITFALMLVVMIITSILGGLFSIPAMMIGLVQGFTIATGEGTANPSTLPMVVTTVVGSIGSYFIYVISYVAISIQYFNLKEQKDQTSLFKKVSEIAHD
jgi:hypothetical protein